MFSEGQMFASSSPRKRPPSHRRQCITFFFFCFFGYHSSVVDSKWSRTDGADQEGGNQEAAGYGGAVRVASKDEVQSEELRNLEAVNRGYSHRHSYSYRHEHTLPRTRTRPFD
jgi:hypothetical protein